MTTENYYYHEFIHYNQEIFRNLILISSTRSKIFPDQVSVGCIRRTAGCSEHLHIFESPRFFVFNTSNLFPVNGNSEVNLTERLDL